MSDDERDDLYLLVNEAEVLATRVYRQWGTVWECQWMRAGPPSPYERRLLALTLRADRRTERRQAKLETA